GSAISSGWGRSCRTPRAGWWRGERKWSLPPGVEASPRATPGRALLTPLGSNQEVNKPPGFVGPTGAVPLRGLQAFAGRWGAMSGRPLVLLCAATVVACGGERGRSSGSGPGASAAGINCSGGTLAGSSLPGDPRTDRGESDAGSSRPTGGPPDEADSGIANEGVGS